MTGCDTTCRTGLFHLLKCVQTGVLMLVVAMIIGCDRESLFAPRRLCSEVPNA